MTTAHFDNADASTVTEGHDDARDTSPAAAAAAVPPTTPATDDLLQGPPPHVLARKPTVKIDPKGFLDQIEAFISKLSVRDTFWSRVCSLIWLPLAFFSGIRMKQLDSTTFQAILPFRRFNRNWYRAMAGGALLANSEIAGGMYVFGICGEDYTVVCKQLNYTFLRPCYGPALYRMKPREDVQTLLKKGSEFNITVDLEISQHVPGDRDRRVGRCDAIFHVTPKIHHKSKAQRKRV